MPLKSSFHGLRRGGLKKHHIYISGYLYLYYPYFFYLITVLKYETQMITLCENLSKFLQNKNWCPFKYYVLSFCK